MSDNMSIYEAFRHTPETAKKVITDGKLKGKTDINPVWRIEMLTKQFGPIGQGWNYKVTRTEYLAVPQREEIMCFVDILLYYKTDEGWSEPIYGTGGSMLVENFRTAGLKSNDDGYKMALTDAISVACKQLGMAADVYWAAGESKYTRPAPAIVPDEPKPKAEAKPATRKARIEGLCEYHGITLESFKAFMKALQESGQISTKTTGAMDDQEFDVLLSLVHTAINDTIAS